MQHLAERELAAVQVRELVQIDGRALRHFRHSGNDFLAIEELRAVSALLDAKAPEDVAAFKMWLL